MEKARVYYTDMRTTFAENLPQKLERLLKTAGFCELSLQDKYTAIKIHFGEAGNMAYLRPNYARVVVDLVKQQGGKPFLTDCNTLYVGGRKDALEHIETAYVNGYSPFSTGCHIIIGDGLKGMDEVEVPVPNGEYFKTAKIGRAVMDADVIISLNHFKGHENTGFGGAIKNLGMGCGSRAGKMAMHNAGKPHVEQELCVGCRMCARQCAQGAITFQGHRALIDKAKCVGCGRCIGACAKDAIQTDYDETNEILNCKMAEYAAAVVHGRPQFHISLVIDVSPYCDCHAENDVPIVPNVGMFASFDAVALDMACADAVNRQPVMPGSRLEKLAHTHGDHFCDNHPTTDWRSQLIHAEKIGMGTREYELIRV